MKNLPHKFTLPMGDWSGDGHDHCEYRTVHSNKSVQECRGLHFKCPEVFGFEIGDICKEYEEYQIAKHIAVILEDNEIIGGKTRIISHEGTYSPSYDELAVIWMDILHHIDSSLEYVIDTVDHIEMLAFYGYDEKKRHLQTPGYGLYMQ